MASYKFLMPALLLVCAPLLQAAEETPLQPSEECRAALQAFATHVSRQQGYAQHAELESSPAGDQVRLACDGSTEAYSRSLAEIMQPYQAALRAELPAGTDSALADNVGTLLVLIAIGAAIAGHPISWNGVITIP